MTDHTPTREEIQAIEEAFSLLPSDDYYYIEEREGEER